MKIKILIPVVLLAAFWNVRNAFAQTADNGQRVDLLYKAVNAKLHDEKNGLYYETTDSAKNPNPHSWLWPLCALIQATNEMEALHPGKQYMPEVELAIDQYYSAKPPCPAYQDYVLKERTSSRFYDDNEWIAIAYLDAYNRTHKKTYLDRSEMIYRFIMSGKDTVAGGGIYWKEGDKNSKNTCSNGPGILIALQLYKITKKKAYLNTALELYHWVNAHLQSPEGVYYDNIKIPSLKIATAIYTYNTGTMLQADALLYDITKDQQYLSEAQRVAAAGRVHFVKNGRLPDDYWFNAVMLRGYIELYKIDKNPQWIDFFAKDADAIWNNERNAENMVGTKAVKSLIDQAAMMEIYARLQELKVE